MVDLGRVVAMAHKLWTLQLTSAMQRHKASPAAEPKQTKKKKKTTRKNKTREKITDNFIQDCFTIQILKENKKPINIFF